ncbi:hypothetical protein B7P43_G16444 [Cryptotermes secundus]|uniref:G-protein coupled receptors family 1 profile domain-containing protein n=1 Tax=Cryptotermes secundus TaxID=105785 RepID=A0A2J7QH76_9NEOP|nr:hypothetical protein B7P43_G16444 [Cryptotermes secundus]
MNLSDEYTQMIVEDCLTRRLKENVSHFDIMENMSNVQNNFSVLGVTLRLLQQNCNSLAANFEEASASSSIIPVLSRPLLVLEAVALGLMILLTIGGNILVIVAVVPSPTLRSPTHSLIVNLAIADLLLGVTVLPLSATRELSGVWLLGPSLCSIWTALDVLCCTASILSLCGISVDRYIGVSRPLAYSRILTKRRARGMIAGIWALALAISIAPPLGWREEPRPGEDQSNDSECHFSSAPASSNRTDHPGTSVSLLATTEPPEPAPMTMKSYSFLKTLALNSCTGSTLLYDSAADRGSVGASSCCGSDAWPSSEERRRLTVAGLYGRAAKFRRQKKAAKTLGIVVGGFLLCWFPFFILLPIDAACPTCDVAGLFNFAFWLGYFNSCINPFIYACSSRELRRAFRGIICWKRKHTSNMAVSLTARSRDLSLSSTTSISTTRRVQ